MTFRTFCSRLSFLCFCTLLPLPRFFTTTAKTPLVFFFLALVASESIAIGPDAAALPGCNAAALMTTTLSIEWYGSSRHSVLYVILVCEEANK